jgi:hypothetical protein
LLARVVRSNSSAGACSGAPSSSDSTGSITVGSVVWTASVTTTSYRIRSNWYSEPVSKSARLMPATKSAGVTNSRPWRG